eukprot:7200680-Prymnesium_polylepis.1
MHRAAIGASSPRAKVQGVDAVVPQRAAAFQRHLHCNLQANFCTCVTLAHASTPPKKSPPLRATGVLIVSAL